VPPSTARSRPAGVLPSYPLAGTALGQNSWNAPSSHSDQKRQIPAWLSDDVSAVSLLEQPLPLLKQESCRHLQGLGRKHRVGLARHVDAASALHFPDEPPWHAGPL
jgi:hypothetical protein